MPTPANEWKWYGYAGHLIVSTSCCYHLCTRIGNYLVSTVGDYRPVQRDGSRNERETIGAGKDSFYETYVFDCSGEDKDGNPIQGGGEIDGERYADSNAAEAGHARYCEKYAAL